LTLSFEENSEFFHSATQNFVAKNLVKILWA